MAVAPPNKLLEVDCPQAFPAINTQLVIKVAKNDALVKAAITVLSVYNGVDWRPFGTTTSITVC